MARRGSTIGASPLDAVVPRHDAAEGGQVPRTTPGEGSGGSRPPEGSRRERAHPKERLTVHVPAELSGRAKNAVYWTPGLTLARLAERALTAELERLEAGRGEPFPERAEELRGGRPVK